jgi:hypothetical protein
MGPAIALTSKPAALKCPDKIIPYPQQNEVPYHALLGDCVIKSWSIFRLPLPGEHRIYGVCFAQAEEVVS